MAERGIEPMSGKTVLVTGGTGGIGKATAAGLASLGARVGIVGRDRQRADAAAGDIRRETGAAAVSANAASTIAIEIAGAVVRAPRGVDLGWLADVLRAVKAAL